MAYSDINWSATLSTSSGNISPMYVTCMDASGNYVLATTANLAAVNGLVEGVILDPGSPGNTVRVQYTGSIPRGLSLLGTGAASTVGPDATGRLVRGGTPTIGTCNVYGDVVLANTGGGATGATGAAGAPGAPGATGPAPAGTGPVVVTVGVASQAPINLAGGASWVTGALPLANVVSPTGNGFVKVTAGAVDAVASVSTAVLFPGTCSLEMFGAVGDGKGDQRLTGRHVPFLDAALRSHGQDPFPIRGKRNPRDSPIQRPNRADPFP